MLARARHEMTTNRASRERGCGICSGDVAQPRRRALLKALGAAISKRRAF